MGITMPKHLINEYTVPTFRELPYVRDMPNLTNDVPTFGVFIFRMSLITNRNIPETGYLLYPWRKIKGDRRI